MRKRHQRQLLELLETIREAQSEHLYESCQSGALHIGEFIEKIEGKGTNAVELLEEYCDLLYRAYNGEIGEKPLRRQLNKIENSIKFELKPDKYKALFLPYYDNTWETMKSVYDVFSSDPMFETEVVIIPIMRNTNVGTKFIWEDYLTPAGIPNTHYDAYSFEEDLPDVVFYNQPYDGVNIPKFQSQNIRKNTDCMVYIPYGIAASSALGESYENNLTGLDSIQRCDIYIAQSKTFCKQYTKGTLLERKALEFGHPKCDCLYEAKIHGNFTRYLEWESAIGKRRVIFLNTHYTYMAEGVVTHPGVRRLIDSVAQNENLFLIWRPHPQAFLMKMSIEMQVMLDFAHAHERMILDRTPSITPAYMYSNAVVSLFPSSIVMDSLFLDLPVFLLGREDSKSALAARLRSPFYSAIAHENFDEPLPDDGSDLERMRLYTEQSVFAPLDAFLREIENGEDSKREARAEFRIREFPNSDGTIAKKILESVKARLG
ncbi:hypothetical protein [Lacrimispora indolis]|uniref:hypothetical protein n=1 Tax=Lacrimispora indolis TaxID=69825 RepID=UPI00041BE33F|nr:hypothetical protein [[Clostridium] methoxybenzovorans]